MSDERPTLDQAHENWVNRLRGNHQPPQGGGRPQGQRGDAPTQGRRQNGQPSQQQNGRRQQGNQQGQQQSGPGPFQPVQQQSAQQRGQQMPSPQSSAPSTEGTGLREGFYLVRGAVLKPTLGGGSRTSVQLQNRVGRCLQAYTQGPDPRLAPGVTLCNVKLSSRSNDGVTFYTLDAYDIVTYTAQEAA